MTTAPLSESDVPERREPTPQDFVDMQASPEFQELRTRLRRFVFPVTVFFLAWYACTFCSPPTRRTSWRPR